MGDVFRYDRYEDKWDTMPNMRANRTQFTAVIRNDKLFAISGNTIQEEIQQPTFQQQVYNQQLGNFRRQPRQTAMTVTHGIATVETLDYKTTDAVWVKSKPLNNQRANAVSSVFQNRIYVVGGNNCSNSLEILDEAESAWTLVSTSMNVDRRGFGLDLIMER